MQSLRTSVARYEISVILLRSSIKRLLGSPLTTSEMPCGSSTLTGRNLLIFFPVLLKREFRLHFLSDIMENTDEVYLRSSNRTRTIESLQQVVHGLFPLAKQGEFFVPHICVRLVLAILLISPFA